MATDDPSRMSGALACLGNASPAAVARLFADADEREAGAGKMLGRQGDRIAGAFVIQEGLVRLFRAHDSGRELVLWTLADGDCFCFSPPCSPMASPFSAQCLAPTRYVQISGEAWSRYVCAEVERMSNVADCFARERGDLARWAQDLALKTVPERLRSHLATLVDRRGIRTARGWRLDHGVTRAQLAAAVGTAPEVVIRALAELEVSGILERRPRHLLILDAARLGVPPIRPRLSLERSSTKSARAGGRTGTRRAVPVGPR